MMVYYGVSLAAVLDRKALCEGSTFGSGRQQSSQLGCRVLVHLCCTIISVAPDSESQRDLVVI